MGDMADWILAGDECDVYDYPDEDDFDDDALDAEPPIWEDHTGKRWRLSQMETSHLVFINRLVVNEWAKAYGLRPVPIKNPVAMLNPDCTPEHLIEIARRARLMAEEVLRRLDEGEQIDGGVRVVWERVVNKIQECLRISGQPLDQKLLQGLHRQLTA